MIYIKTTKAYESAFNILKFGCAFNYLSNDNNKIT